MQYATLREKIAAEKAARVERHAHFDTVIAEAFAAGAAAAAAAVPTPMTVVESDPVSGLERGRAWYVSEGACGFAWVKFQGSVTNTSFGKYLVKQGHARKGYPSGLQIWITAYNQSVDRKYAAARAMSEVFNRHGFACYADSRLD